MESLSSYQELWDKVKAKLASHYSESIYKESFENTYVYKVVGSKIIVIVPSPYIEAKINSKYLSQIKEITDSLSLQKCEFKFQTKAHFESENLQYELPKKLRINNLDPRFTFDNFVSGSSNIVAFRSAMKIAENPGVINPLYIFGSVGLGKTHLMGAIGNYISEIYPDYKVLYVQASDFAKEYVEATQTKNMAPFIEKYSDLDVFLVDDIQQIQSKELTQFEFFNLFNELYMNKKQIVITSDNPANKLKIMPRLTSRFESGLVVDITNPDLSQRIDILKKKLEERNVNFTLSDDALEFIASNVTDNIRALDGALNRVINYCEIMIQTNHIELHHAQEALQNILSSKMVSKTKNADDLIDIVAEFYQVTKNDLISPNRNQKYVLPRQICMFLLKKQFDLTYSKIGKILGGRDHSTVMSGATKIEKEYDLNFELKTAIDTITSKLNKVDN